MNRLGLFCWNQLGQNIQLHKLSILVLSVKLALKHQCLTSSEWFWLLTAAEISGSEDSGLSEADPKFRHWLVKEQSVWHNCSSVAIKLKMPSINGCWEKIGQDCRSKQKISQITVVYEEQQSAQVCASVSTVKYALWEPSVHEEKWSSCCTLKLKFTPDQAANLYHFASNMEVCVL